MRLSWKQASSSSLFAEAGPCLCVQVLFLDPAQQQTVELVKLSELFYKHMIPLRCVPEDQASAARSEPHHPPSSSPGGALTPRG